MKNSDINYENEYVNFEDCSNFLVNQKKAYKKMYKIAKENEDLVEGGKITLLRVKDYKHYYKKDWTDGNPFDVDKSEKWRCRLSQPFRKIRQIIFELCETNNLDMLNPIIEYLEKEGIYLSINIPEKIDNSSIINDAIDEMDQYQDEICNLADYRKEIRKETCKNDICTKHAFDSIVQQLAKISIDSTKLDSGISNLRYIEFHNLKDNDLYNNIIDNTICKY